MGRPPLDWEWLMDAYNKSYGTHHVEVKRFIFRACKMHGVNKFATLMGIGGKTLNDKRRDLKIRRCDLEPEFIFKRDVLAMLYNSGKMEHMTRKEIIKLTGFSGGWIAEASRRFNLKYKKIY